MISSKSNSLETKSELISLLSLIPLFLNPCHLLFGFHKNVVEAKRDQLIKRKIELCDNRRLVMQEKKMQKYFFSFLRPEKQDI